MRSATPLVLVLVIACGGGGGDELPPESCGPGGSCPTGSLCNDSDGKCYDKGEFPDTEITVRPPAAMSSTAATFDFSSTKAGVTFECRVDSDAFEACPHPTTVTVPEGSHRFDVRAITARGFRDPTPASDAWATDLTPPRTTIVSGPPAATRDANAAFSFSADETATYECSLDGAAFAACPSAFAGLAEGAHTLRVRAVDAAGNVDPNPPSWTWRVDRTGPAPSITSGPDEGATSGRSVTFAFTHELGGTYSCKLDDDPAADCSGGTVTYTDLAGGPHSLTVIGSDDLGNAGTPVTRGWTVNAAGPTVTLTSGPSPGATTGPTVALAFTASAAGSTFACALDAPPFVACTSPQSLTDLAEGTHTFRVHATDGRGNTGGDTSVTFTVDRTAPMVTIVSPAPGSTTPSTLMIVWTADGPATFACKVDDGAPAPCQSPLTLAGLAGGAHRFVLTATDAVGNSVTLPTLGFTVNDPPTISAVADQTTDEDTPLAGIAFTVADAQTATLDVTVSCDDATLFPDGSLVLGGSDGSRTLTVTPAPNQSGSATITLTVSDGALSATVTFKVTVSSVADVPTVSAIGPKSTSEGQPTAAIPFTVADPDTAVADLQVSADSDNQTLCPDANIAIGGSGGYRTITVTPAAQQSGTARITVRVSDGTNAATTTFLLTVGAVADAPTLSAIADQTTAEDVAKGPIAFTVDDPDTALDQLTVTASSAAPSLIPDANIVLGGSGASRTVTLTPAPDQNGSAAITLTVSDGTSSASRTFNVTVTAVNDPPSISDIGPQSTQEATPTAAIPFSVGDVETAAGSLTVTAASSNTALLPVSGIAFGGSGASRTVTLSPAVGQNGTSTVTITVSDGAATSSDSFVLSVGAVDDPPTISDIGAQTTNEDTALTTSFTVGDADTALASLQLSGASSNQALVPNAGVTFGGSGANRTVTVAPAANQSGTATITVSVTDGTSTRSDSFVLTVTAVNDAPTISAVGNQTTAEDTATPAIAFTVGDVETAPSNLTVTASSSNTTLVPNANLVLGGSGASRTVTIAPAANQNGTSTITLSVSDGAATATSTFLLTVTAANDPPTISAVGNQTTNEDTAASVSFTVADPETAAGSLTVTASSSNTTLLPNANIALGGSGGNRSATLTPAANQSGTTTVTLTVSDGSAQATTVFTLTVTAVNDPPTISDIANQTVNEDNATAALAFTVGDVETAAASLTVTGSSSNSTLVPNANIAFGGSGASRTVTVTPAANQSGTATITVAVSDGSATAGDTFVLTVNAVNDPPTISDITNQTVNEDTTVGPLAFTVGDAETAAASLTVTGSSSNTALVPNANITFGGSGASRTVTVNPAANQSGTATITVTVSDGSSTASDTFILTVNPVNDPPTISSIGNQTTTAGTATGAITFTVGDVESGAAALTLSGSSSNTALVPNANIAFGGSGANRTVTVTPTNMTGMSTITVTVSDGTATAQASFVLTVNAAPTVTVTATVTPAGAGTATVSTCGAASCQVTPGASVTLNAVAAASYTFVNWTGATCPKAGATTAAITFAAVASTCTANFTYDCYLYCPGWGTCQGNLCWVNHNLVVDGQNAYWTQDPYDQNGNHFNDISRIMKSPLTGGAGTLLTQLSDLDTVGMKQLGSSLMPFGFDRGFRVINKSNGGVFVPIDSGLGAVGEEVDSTYAYLLTTTEVSRVPLAQHNLLVTLTTLTGGDGPRAITSDAINLYWIDGNRVRSMSKLDPTPQTLFDIPTVGYDVDAGLFRFGSSFYLNVPGNYTAIYDTITQQLSQWPASLGCCASVPFRVDGSGVYLAGVPFQAGGELWHMPLAGADWDTVLFDVDVVDFETDATYFYILGPTGLTRVAKP